VTKHFIVIGVIGIVDRVPAMDFGLNILSNIIANLVTSIPLVLGLCFLWRRYYFVLKVWGIPFWSRSPRAYTIIVSAEEYLPKRFQPFLDEINGIIDLFGFFSDFWIQLVCRLSVAKPQIPDRVDPTTLQNTNLILVGGPTYNQITKEHLRRLAKYGLSFTFQPHAGEECQLRDIIRGTTFDPDAVTTEALEEGNYTDYGLFIKAPHVQESLTVYIFAGCCATGTKGAVDVAIDPDLCRALLALKKKQQIGDYFVAVISVKVENFVPQHPKIEMIRAIARTHHLS
jgi:hypothetical protein